MPQVPFSAGIGCNDDIRDIFPENQLFDSVELAAGLFDDYQLPVLWEHGKRIHVPGLVLFVVLLRISQCDKVTQRPCDDIVCSFYISILFFLLQCKTRAMSLPHGRFFLQ